MDNSKDYVLLESRQGDRVITLRVDHSEQSLSDMLDNVREFLLAVGYHPDTVNEYLGS